MNTDPTVALILTCVIGTSVLCVSVLLCSCLFLAFVSEWEFRKKERNARAAVSVVPAPTPVPPEDVAGAA